MIGLFGDGGGVVVRSVVLRGKWLEETGDLEVGLGGSEI